MHVQGVDLNGNAGVDFFTFDTINGLSVNLTDPKQVAASGAGKPALDGSNALALADVSNSSNGPDNTYRTLIIGLGVETQTVNRRVDIQNDITKQVDAAKDSSAGVDIDEEMANMIAYQHTYGAASRVITAIDQMLDRLINGTGMVGR
jgi:flagellar hook-associated protein 1 FlgK